MPLKISVRRQIHFITHELLKKKRYVAMKIMIFRRHSAELISNVVTLDVSSALLVQVYFSFGVFLHEAVRVVRPKNSAV